jgi:hypothetical protein
VLCVIAIPEFSGSSHKKIFSKNEKENFMGDCCYYQ